MPSAPYLPAVGEVLILDCAAAVCREHLDPIASWLAPDDAARFASIKAAPVRLAFLTGRLLIGWLHRAAHQCAAAPRLRLGPHGKPCFEEDTPWRFSISHAADRVAIAVARERDVGFDLEHSGRRADFSALSMRAFHPNERAWWNSRGARPADFMRMWTLKEAWLKTGGEGITVDLRALDVSPWIEGVSHPLRSSAFPPVAAGFIAAVVMDGEMGQMHRGCVSLEDLIVPNGLPG